VTTPGEPRQPDEGGRPPDPRYPPYPPQQYPQQYPPPQQIGPHQNGPQQNGPQQNGPGPYSADLPYVYNPYGNVSYPSSYESAPAGLAGGAEALPARRPASLHLALVLLIMSTLPYLLFGLVALLGAGTAAAALPPDDLGQLQELGIDLEQLVRVTGIVLLSVAAVFLLLAVLAWSGRRWARALAAAMTVGFVLMVAASVAAAGAQGLPVDAASLLLLAVPVVLALVGVALMFAPGAREWFSRPRR
jgi:hypothetical protein